MTSGCKSGRLMDRVFSHGQQFVRRGDDLITHGRSLHDDSADDSRHRDRPQTRHRLNDQIGNR